MPFFVKSQQSYRPRLIGGNDLRSISCEIMDRILWFGIKAITEGDILTRFKITAL